MYYHGHSMVIDNNKKTDNNRENGPDKFLPDGVLEKSSIHFSL